MTSDGELTRGWKLIVTACTGVIFSSIVLPYYSIGVLVDPVTSEFGWSRAQFQAAIFFSSGLGALTAPIVGWLNDRYGARRVALPGIVGLSIGFFIASTLNGQLWMLYIAYGSMALLGAGTIPVTWTRAIATNFFQRRGLALGLTLTGTGICAMLVPHYLVWVSSHFGWRGAYIALGLATLVIAGSVVYLGFKPVEPDKKDHDLNAYDGVSLTLYQALCGYRFWILLFSILFAYFGFSGIAPNLFASLTDNGLSANKAATVQSIYGISIIIGRIVVGYLIDRFWAPGVAAVSLLLPMAGALMFLGSPDFYLAITAAFLIGFSAGAELDLLSFLAARYFGLRHYAKIYSILYAGLAICSGVAPMLFARVYDVTNNYDFGFLVAAILFSVSAVLVLGLGRYPKRIETSHSPTS